MRTSDGKKVLKSFLTLQVDPFNSQIEPGAQSRWQAHKAVSSSIDAALRLTTALDPFSEQSSSPDKADVPSADRAISLAALAKMRSPIVRDIETGMTSLRPLCLRQKR